MDTKIERNLIIIGHGEIGLSTLHYVQRHVINLRPVLNAIVVRKEFTPIINEKDFIPVDNNRLYSCYSYRIDRSRKMGSPDFDYAAYRKDRKKRKKRNRISKQSKRINRR